MVLLTVTWQAGLCNRLQHGLDFYIKKPPVISIRAKEEHGITHCPYCGSSRLAPSLSGKEIKGVHVGGGLEPVRAEVGVSFWRNPYPKKHTHCPSCDKSFNVVDILPDYILKNSGTKDKAAGDRIASLVTYYCQDSNMVLSDMILNHCTGIVKPYRTTIPYIPIRLLRSKLHVCLAVHGQWIYLSLSKIRKKNGGSRVTQYRIDSLELSV